MNEEQKVKSADELTHMSLFGGMGGFSVGAEMSDITTILECEIEEWNQKFLKSKYPNSTIHGDIKTLQNPTRADIISAGFPCQNISIAASKNRTGIDGDKSGLWTEVLRIAIETDPSYIILENSSAIRKHGLDTILKEFANIGYDAEWQTLQGFQFGLPQRRRRIYAILYPSSIGNRMEERQIFARWNKFEYPDWRDSDPKIYGVYDVVPDRVYKHRALGNAVQPLIAHYLFECIKLNHKEYGN